MTQKRSEFGSLEQRRARMRDAPSAASVVRHVWLDATVPALVTARRRFEGEWQGYVLYVRDEYVLHEWIDGSRITPLTTTPSPGSAPI